MGDKISVILCRQSKAVCSGAETIPGGLSLPEIYCRSTWNGLELIDLNSFRSASVSRASHDGKSAGRKPHLRSPFRRRSSLFRCSSVAYLHHAGGAYCRETTVVVLATRCNSWERRPCDLSVRLDSFIRRAKRGGFLPDEAPSFRQMAAQTDSSLFKTLISNPNHVPRSLCTLRPTIQYHLRSRPHPFNLPVSDNRNFLSRLMFLGTY